ncbi:Protein N-acetyltransferase, RimJ/RimL family [Roseateles sp. YR242]|uniref:GNAT family N-acetyltransferase n=1 Tax=Roseateles sp. YR242 TaxID=1855305 RepID=UPI0008D1511A|nr:GNAT family N-acetyltransferase [Roseateles sp. YR242]SEL74060.1 Protein N-acetyltransferase, RimJ/RimL family [Roseateles sp. YR242]
MTASPPPPADGPPALTPQATQGHDRQVPSEPVPVRLPQRLSAQASRWMPEFWRRWADWVPIRPLGRRHRRRIAQHLLSLAERDRYLRFGYAARDEQIQKYVDGLNFSRDEVLGIFNRKLQLIAVAHLAYEPTPQIKGRPAMAEFGVSVLNAARGRGFGGRLFERAALHARNRGIDTLFIHALSENGPMLAIARKAGAKVERDGSESEAWLRLPPDSVSSHVDEALERHMAEVDFQLKRHLHTLGNFIDGVAEVKSKISRKASGKSAKQ